MSNLITYELLYEALRKEKQSRELQKLDLDFFKNAVNYLKEKNKILTSQKTKNSIFSQTETKKTEKQIENTKKLLKDLYERRENKIIQLAILNSRSESKVTPTLLVEEEKFYDELIKLLSFYREGILGNLLSSNLPRLNKPKEIKSPQKENKLIAFTKAVPKFIGNDLNIYGPFEPEDIALLPNKTAKLLVKKKRATEITHENT